MGYYNWANKQLVDLMAKNPTYERSKYPGMQLGMANQFMNSQMPGLQNYRNNLLSTQGNTLDFLGKNATDASQLMGAAAGIKGQTDQSFGDLQGQEADWKKFGLGNLNNAYAANSAEDQRQQELKQQYYENEVALRGAQAANKLAKRKALWNTVGGIAQLGISAFTGNPAGAAGGLGKIFGGGGLGGSPNIPQPL